MLIDITVALPALVSALLLLNPPPWTVAVTVEVRTVVVVEVIMVC